MVCSPRAYTYDRGSFREKNGTFRNPVYTIPQVDDEVADEK